MESIYEAHVDPESPNHAHGIALQLVGTGQRVLELGAAGGHVTRALKARGNTVTAVELDAQFEDTLSAAADEVIMTNLDWLDLSQKLRGQKFDVILAGDVLEHCVHPELVVFQFHELLADNGKLIVSLPNVDSWWRKFLEVQLPSAQLRWECRMLEFLLRQLNMYGINVMRRCTSTSWNYDPTPFGKK